MGCDYKVIEGDVADAEDLTSGDFHAVLCDPPYGLGDPIKGDEMAEVLRSWIEGQTHDVDGKGFMGSRWDVFVMGPPQWEAIQAVCKPGAFLASFGGTRTFDLQCVAQRLAGWEMRDEIMCWTYGSGFPKSHNVSKAIDETKGADREEVGRKYEGVGNCSDGAHYGDFENSHEGVPVTAPATPEAEAWDGYGTALAPAHEPIGLWRNPTDQTYAECALEEGCGALNIDGCRVPTDEEWSRNNNESIGSSGAAFHGGGECYTESHDAGRWPSNLAICHHPACGAECVEACHVRVMDGQSGESSNGGVSRYFPRFRYNAKAAKAEREAGLHTRDRVTVDDGRDEPIDNPYQRGETKRRNTHPTVKPIGLCKWLATLLLPPPQDEPRRILVPYSGSGSEMISAMLAGWDEVVGIERNAEYADLSRDRLDWWQRHGEDAVEAHKSEIERMEHEAETGQTSLLEEVE